MVENNGKINHYAAAYIVSLCAIYTANIPLSGMRFFIETSVVCLIGTSVSYLWRIRKWSFTLLEAPVIMILSVLSVLAVSSTALPWIMSSFSFQGDRSVALAQLLAWMIAIRSFSLETDTSLLFSCIPPLAMFGLMATIVIDLNILPIFLVYIFFAIFLIVGDLGSVGTGTHDNGIKSKPAFLQSLIATICIVPAFLGGMLISPPLQRLTMNYIRISGIASKVRRANKFMHPHFLRFNDKNVFRVGMGPVSQTNTVVMSVEAPFACYMRGNSYDYYTGSGWRDTLPMNISVDEGGNWNRAFGDYVISPTIITKSYPKSIRVRQTVQILNSDISEIYAAPEIRRIIMTPQIAFTNGAGTIKLEQSLYNMDYTVFSMAPWTAPNYLRRAGNNYPSEIRALYLQLPYDRNSPLFLRLKQLCDNVIKGRTNNYDRIEALKNWIANNCYYSTSAAATPPNTDAASYFLLDYHVGYCDLFATSLAVLCRIAGIPARVATGFAPGEKTGGVYIIREKDSHAWTEAYFPKVGWVTFDATDNARDITLKPKPENLLAMLQAYLTRNQGYSIFFATLAFLAIAFVAYQETRRRSLQSVTRQNGGAMPENNRKIVAFYILAARRLDKKGFARYSEMTPCEYLTIASHYISPDNAVILGLNELTHLCNLAQYSQREMKNEDVEAAEKAYKLIKTNIHTLRREMQPLSTEGSRF